LKEEASQYIELDSKDCIYPKLKSCTLTFDDDTPQKRCSTHTHPLNNPSYLPDIGRCVFERKKG
jgi:hypothetical protein